MAIGGQRGGMKMKIADLRFLELNPFVVQLRDNNLLLPENTRIDFSHLQQRQAYHYLLQFTLPTDQKVCSKLVSLSPEDSTRLDDMLAVPLPKRYFFTVDHCEGNNLYVRPYFINIYHQFDNDLCIHCLGELLMEKTAEELQKDYLCEDFEKPTLFILQHNENENGEINKYKIISGSRELSVQEINGFWEIESKKPQACKGIYASWNLCCISAPHIYFTEHKSSREFAETMNSLKQSLENSIDFTNLWNAYEEMEKILLEQQATEFGKIKYSSRKIERMADGSVKLVFHLCSSYNTRNNKISLAVWDGKTDPQEQGALKSVGTLQANRNQQEIITIADKLNDAIDQSGYLVMDIKGDANIHKRRAGAKKKFLAGNTPIPKLLDIINQAGQFEEDGGIYTNKILQMNFPALTESFLKKHKEFEKIKNNNEQYKALEIAVNTPDIAIIQGPPGTGKTTVIRAIVERFKEKFAAEEQNKKNNDKNYEPRSAEILITSFQNTAVDNAVKVEDVHAFPAYRVTSKSRPSQKYQKNLQDWVKNCLDNLRGQLQNSQYQQYSQQLQELEEEYKTFCNNGKNWLQGQEILRKYLMNFGTYIQSGLRGQMENLCASAASIEQVSTPQIDALSLPKILQSQLLTNQSFVDGGKDRARKLYTFILWHPEKSDLATIKDNLNKLINTDENTPEFQPIFTRYVRDVQTLKNTYCQPEQSLQKRIETMDAVLKTLPSEIKRNIHNAITPEGKQMAETFIAAEYLKRFKREYKTLIAAYSNTTGATCQKVGSFELKDKEYDLVIVDEAARAIPLDLFIPMVKAKKIILVGDQAQLTHMLTHEVMSALRKAGEKDPRLQKRLELLEVSLFEKLYTYLLREGKAIRLKYQFRYNDKICKFVSKFYDGYLETGESIDKEKIIPQSGLYDNRPLVAVDIDFEQGKEQRDSGSSSLHRPAEVKRIVQDLNVLVNNCPNSSVGIITFYSEQSTKLQEAIEKAQFNREQLEKISIGTVDAFQGEEYDYILLSCVRSNRNRIKDPDTGQPLVTPEPEVGFLNNDNRLCVAFSRAHRQLIVYGDKSTVTQIQHFKDLYDNYAA